MIGLLDPRAWGIAILAGIMLFGAGYLKGIGSGKAGVVAAVNAATIEVKDKQAAILAEAGTQQAQAQEAIRTIYKDRIIYREKKVPYEVIVRQDARCIIPRHFVSLWNSGNRAEPADFSAIIDEAPSAVKLSDIGSQHEREAELCNATTAQLNGLIDAIEAVKTVK